MRRAWVWGIAGAMSGAALAPMPRTPVAAALLGIAGWRMSGFASARAARRRAAAIDRAVPDALDLLSVCALAGMGLEAGLRMVAEATRGPLREALSACIRALDVGMPREQALQELVRASGNAPEIGSFVRAVLRSERYGTPVSAVLIAHAADARARQLTSVRERAMKAPVRMLFPLTLCFLPAFVLLAIAPSMLVAFRSLSGL